MRGYRDWNTLHAAIGNRPPGPPVSVGHSVVGAYLGKPFRAEALAAAALGDGRFRVTVHFDEPINISAFESFEALRRRAAASITREGESLERITGGAPQFRLTL